MKKSSVTSSILLILAIILIIAVTILSRQLSNLDEVWNYNFSRNIVEGRLPYKDFNIIQMPGLFLITAVFLKIANELIVTRILGIILCSAIMFATYKIFNNFKIDKSISGFLTLGITFIFLNYFYLDYNFLNLFIILLLMLLEYKNLDNDTKKYNILAGILAGCSFLIKQTTGAFIIFAFLLFKILEIDKSNKSQKGKTLIYRIGGIIIPIILFMIYLTINNIWKDFIDYTILGIFTFGNKISYASLLTNDKLYIRALSILMPAYFVGMIITCLWKKNKKLLLLLIYGLAAFIVVYPISDVMHFLIGALPGIIGLICIISIILNHYIIEIKENLRKLIINVLTVLFYGTMIAIILIEGRNFINIIKSNYNYTELKHFKYIPVSENFKNYIEKIDSFIIDSEKNGKEIYILDATSCMYMIPINRYTKNYDLFLKGNLGSGGEQAQIESLKDLDNAYILILSNANERNWQTPTSVMEYIESNLKKFGSIGSFDVYGLDFK